MRSIDDLELATQVESYIIGKIILAEEPWSSRVTADEIVQIVKNYLDGNPTTGKKPWEHFAIEMCV